MVSTLIWTGNHISVVKEGFKTKIMIYKCTVLIMTWWYWIWREGGGVSYDDFLSFPQELIIKVLWLEDWKRND